MSFVVSFNSVDSAFSYLKVIGTLYGWKSNPYEPGPLVPLNPPPDFDWDAWAAQEASYEQDWANQVQAEYDAGVLTETRYYEISHHQAAAPPARAGAQRGGDDQGGGDRPPSPGADWP